MKIFFSRAMDELNAESIVLLDETIERKLDKVGFTLVNPYTVQDSRRRSISGIEGIVESDLRLLAEADVVLADMSIRDRSYIGVVGELFRSFSLGKPSYVWVAESGNHKRPWLQYHASGIVETMDEAIELMVRATTVLGERTNCTEALAYYSDVARQYHDNPHSGSLYPDGVDAENVECYRREFASFTNWTRGLRLAGSVVDLGSGSARWSSVLAKSGCRVVCIDAALSMLSEARERSIGLQIEFVHADFLNYSWLREFLLAVGHIDVLMLAFVLSGLTAREEVELMSILRELVPSKTALVIFENQSSLFSPRRCFSRSEIQVRKGIGGCKEYRLYKRSFFAADVRRILQQWGSIDEICQTENFLVGGVAR